LLVRPRFPFLDLENGVRSILSFVLESCIFVEPLRQEPVVSRLEHGNEGFDFYTLDALRLDKLFSRSVHICVVKDLQW
jgi:hypothetical protein